ncbi:xanthine dehydrogenase family protein molybdopterin-binding subunit [Chitinophaga agrisoli]|uniref:Xanthine dehydrogenase family protein molybdopterin-binding subunit n=1 Tax=Chitinophaga agrisoli TaxID=2607653 RepID=A0A5B2VHV6_9BACT|nr:xanthine dehydrogenase family protein molybdopterin-binding subunit [Chitinophaga agrisoli]KAA2238485.1 xanthine dehydrogenase family protein molybdopterin-binding subunit [Chitinophaga agrisoli]
MTLSPDINRRQFIRTAALATGGLIIAFNVPAAGKRRRTGQEPAFAPNAFLQVGTDNSVTVILSHCEMGQGIWTTLCMLIAEELDANWKTLQAVHAPAAPAYFHTIYATQRTGGSSSLLSEFDRYRKAGATARQLLVQAAANRYKVAVQDCRTEDGMVIIGDKKIPYSDLAADAAALPTPADVPLKDPANWKIIGKRIKRMDTPAKITGKAIFGMDVQLPGMLTAMVARGPAPGAKVKGYEAAAAMAIPGVRQVVAIPGGVAVLADDFWAAKKGRETLQVDWDLGPGANMNSDALLKEFRERANKGGIAATNTGNPEEAFTRAAHIVEAEYYQPFLAHAPMEPLNCTVQLSADKCEIWTGTQTQTDDQRGAAEITGLPVEKIFINTLFLGGSFGRRNITRSDFVREAVEVAKASGKVVKTVWTREDDIKGGMYRPAFLHRFKVGLDAGGTPIAWKQISVGQSVMTGGPFEKLAVINGVDMFSIEGMQTAPHVKAVKDQRIEVNTPEWPVSVDNWRAVGLSHTIFAMESLSDEMAIAAGKDPVAYRRMLYKDEPRLVGVLNLAAEKSGWGAPLPKGHGRGVAVFEAVGSFVAIVAEVAVLNNTIHVNKVTCAIDCGIAVSPDGIISQTEGSIAFGISTALYSEITFRDGKVQQRNFYDYPMLRIHEMPQVAVFIVPSKEKPGGVGEASVGQMIPALTNAVYAATGKRIRHLPLRNQPLNGHLQDSKLMG